MKVTFIKIYEGVNGHNCATVYIDSLTYCLYIDYTHYTNITRFYIDDDGFEIDLTPILSKELKKIIFLALRAKLLNK